jgi:ABC-type multidrug transport system fused ATPase/permease subunit
MLAYTYPLADLFGTMLGLFVFFIWFWLLIVIFGDIFRSRDLGGGAKMLWVLFVIILPFLGIFVYLIARGGKMHERAEQQAQQQKQAFDSYVKDAAGSTSSAEQLTQLADLKEKGTITEAEFEAQKAKILT